MHSGSRTGSIASSILARPGPGSNRQIKMINAGFFRNRGSYLVGRIIGADGPWRPLALALLNGADGIFVDAVITESDDLQFVFSSTLANFHVTCEAYHDLADFLFSIMPKRPHGLHYSTIGFNHVGKVVVMRQLESELAGDGEQLDHAPSARGSVAMGFTAPSCNYVLKVIRDKPTANYKWDVFDGVASVLGKYRRGHDINRAGSMLDNIIYYNIALPGRLFTSDLLEELMSEAPGSVTRFRDTIFFKHLIVQMKMLPCRNSCARAGREESETAVTNLGRCIKNNAAANIFNKNLDGRNYGVSPILKVYLFDYDAVEDLTDVKVHTNTDRVDGDEDIPDWFFEEGYVLLPEEIEPHLRIKDRGLRRLFREAHGDLLTTAYWENIQEMMRQNRIPSLTPYPDTCRLAEVPARSSQVGRQSHSLDSGNGAGFVIIGGIAGNPHGTDNCPGPVADQHAAGYGYQIAIRQHIHRLNEMGLLFRPVEQRAIPASSQSPRPPCPWRSLASSH